MIHYQLRCADEHSFEAWFRDAAAYDEQVASGHVECPYCGSTQIAKMAQAPDVSTVEVDGSVLDDARARDVARKILDAVNDGREDDGTARLSLSDTDRRES